MNDTAAQKLLNKYISSVIIKLLDIDLRTVAHAFVAFNCSCGYLYITLSNRDLCGLPTTR